MPHAPHPAPSSSTRLPRQKEAPPSKISDGSCIASASTAAATHTDDCMYSLSLSCAQPAKESEQGATISRAGEGSGLEREGLGCCVMCKSMSVHTSPLVCSSVTVKPEGLSSSRAGMRWRSAYPATTRPQERNRPRSRDTPQQLALLYTSVVIRRGSWSA
eukprot:scaffold18204_cov30-Tisochrysis_lutea.AAC.2